ncbi:MAG: hypothetical protein V2I34_08195, partial [Bacteroidales bacterium]|nr:hypothetical protein [Bacteroidales bacterium]
PELKKKVKECEYAIGKDENADHFNNNLAKLHRYIGLLSSLSGIESGSLLAKLNSRSFDDSTAVRANRQLDSLRSFFREQRLEAMDQRDSILYRIEKEEGRERIIEMKQNNYNNYLADILLNANSTDKIYENEKLLVQKSDPVFMKPTSRIGRAHFFAPYKYFGGLRIDTLWFNVMAIWLMSIFFILTLYYNTLKKLVDLIESISLPFQKK